MKSIAEGNSKFQRERKKAEQNDLPVMCSGCFGFFSKTYKARHQRLCPANGKNMMMPLVDIQNSSKVERFSDDFKELLSTIRFDDVGNFLKKDDIILMIGNRSFGALKRKKDKKKETVRSVRSRMRLLTRVYQSFLRQYQNQDEVKLNEKDDNAADMYRRETIILLGKAINELCEKSSDEDEDSVDINVEATVTNQKSGLKINILNLIKLTAKFLIGHFLMLNEDAKSQRVVDFLQVLKHFEDELFGDALYDLNYRRNVKHRKPKSLPKEDDVAKIIDECERIMDSASLLDFDNFVNIRSATVTYLILFNARRGGEPVRLLLHQWEEALKGEWDDRNDLPEEYHEEMLITFQTGKGADHLVPVMFTPCTHKAMVYLCNKEVRVNAGVRGSNSYIFASTQNSDSHASGWHCINDILVQLDMKGIINATKNRHRVATLLAKFNISDKERELVYKHFGHSETMNQNVYQAAPGRLHIDTTGKLLRILNRDSDQSSSTSQSNSKSSMELTSTSSLLNPLKSPQIQKSLPKVSEVEQSSLTCTSPDARNSNLKVNILIKFC